MNINKKHLTPAKTVLACAVLTLLHLIAVAGVYLLSEGGFSIGAVGFSYDVPELLCYAPFLLPLAADVMLSIKTDIKPFVTLFSAFAAVVICFVFYVMNPGSIADMYSNNYIFFQLALLSLAVRCVYFAAQVLMLKKYKLVILGLFVAVIGIGAFFSSIIFEGHINAAILSANTGTPDKTSWGSINQNVSRDENWQQIVSDSPFRLGEMKTVTEKDEYYTYINKFYDKGTYPYIDGSTVCVPMAVEFARQHLGFEDETANEFVQFSTTHFAYENLMNKSETELYVYNGLDAFIKMGSTDLVIATEPSDEEIAQAESLGVTLKKTPVCFDAFVFITHKDNPVESLTVEQIKKIYRGEITNWKEVGGRNEKIRAFQREKNSGSQTAMENLVMGGSDMIDPIKAKIIAGMSGLVEAVAEYENETASIGYTYRYYIDTLYKNDNIKTVSVNGIAPTDENIRSGAYPFTTNYYGVIRQGDEEKVGGQFLEWMLNDEGQKCIAQAGYITLR